MAEIVNLNRLRKDRARKEKKVQADANAARFGRSKAEREGEKARADHSARALEGHKREPGPAQD